MPNRKDSERDIQGIRFPSGMLGAKEGQEFEKVFQQWSALARRYAAHWGWGKKAGTWKEVHWWYRERANVGMFASAVWMAGGVALEEYGSEKTAVGRKRKSKYKGRTDLCFSLPLRRCDYVAEAKHISADLPKPGQEPEIDKIIRGLRAACKNALAVRKQGTALSMVFVTLDLSRASAGRAEVTEAIEKWTKQVSDDSDDKNNLLKKCLFIWWFFPIEARSLADRTTRKPGTAVFVARPHTFK